MNALAHCAEALYVEGHNAEADAEALEGARLIGTWLPQWSSGPTSLEDSTQGFSAVPAATVPPGPAR